MKLNIIIFVSLLLLAFSSKLAAQGTTPACTTPPQNAYIQQHDGTGKTPIDPTQLKAKAIELATTFPDPYCTAFKVYDYGFTPISQYTKGGYAEDFEAMKLQCIGPNRDQPYLLFAREVDAGGKVTKVWVDVNLPDKDNFACLTATQRSLVRIRVEKATNDALQKNINSPLAMVSAEIMGMDKLKEEVIKIVLCPCDKGRTTCTNDCFKKEDKDLFFQLNGFQPTSSVVKTISANADVLKTEEILYEYSDVVTIENGKDNKIHDSFLAELKDKKDKGFSVLGIVTSDENACPQKTGAKAERSTGEKDALVEALKVFNESNVDYKVWLHYDKDGVSKLLFEEPDHAAIYYGADGSFLGKAGKNPTEIRVLVNNEKFADAKNNLSHKDWQHNWLIPFSFIALEENQKNERLLLNRWANKYQHRIKGCSCEFAASIYRKQFTNEKNEQFYVIYLDPNWVKAEYTSEKQYYGSGSASVNPLEAYPKFLNVNLKEYYGWEMSTTIHTHPDFASSEMSFGRTPVFGGCCNPGWHGGDIGFAFLYNVKILLVLYEEEEVIAFDPEKIKSLPYLYNKVENDNRSMKESLNDKSFIKAVKGSGINTNYFQITKE